MENFHSLGLPESILHSLKLMDFHKPTPIQAQTIPAALQGLDILGSAQTGTGKTAAYGIPLVSYLLNNPYNSALVLAPTRELALQVLDMLNKLLGEKSGIRSVLLIGGDSMPKQLKFLHGKPRLFVGTPGRVNDHLARGSLKLDKTSFLVLDETDRMLDMGFTAQLNKITQFLPEQRQTLMFSATMAPNIVKVAQSYLKDAVRVSVGSTTTPTDKIKQEILHTSEPEKYDILAEQLDGLNGGSCIIFVKTKYGAEKLARKLCANGHDADAIHGDLRQRSRERVIKAFRDGRSRFLVATDIAARGLDIPSIECVINYDLPQCPEDYIHRIGRTGRAGVEGKAISLVTSQDGLKWKNICRLINDGETVAVNPKGGNGEGRRSRSSGQRSGSRSSGFRSGGFRSGGNRFDRPARERSDRNFDRNFDNDGNRSERAERPERAERSDRSERFDRGNRSERSFNPERSFDNDGPRKRSGSGFSDRSFDNDGPRKNSGGGFFGKKKSFGDRPPRSSQSSDRRQGNGGRASTGEHRKSEHHRKPSHD